MRAMIVGLSFLVLPGAIPGQPPDPPPPTVVPGGPGGFPEPGHSPAELARQYRELIPSLIESLKDLDPEVRQHSAMALASLGSVALKPLIEALADPLRDKRAAAAYALGQMGYEGREAIPPLLKALKDDESAVRRSASQAISRILSGDVGVVGFGVRPLQGLMPGRAVGNAEGGRPGVESAPALPSPPATGKPPEKPK